MVYLYLFLLIQIKNPWNSNHFSHNLQQTKFSQCPIFKHACLIGDTGRDRPVVAVLWKLLYECCTIVIYLLLYFHMYFAGLVLTKPSLKNGNWRECGKFSSGLLRYLHFCWASNQLAKKRTARSLRFVLLIKALQCIFKQSFLNHTFLLVFRRKYIFHFLPFLNCNNARLIFCNFELRRFLVSI